MGPKYDLIKMELVIKKRIYCTNLLYKYEFALLIASFCGSLITSTGTTLIESEAKNEQNLQQKTVNKAKAERNHLIQFSVSEASFCAQVFDMLHFGYNAQFLSSAGREKLPTFLKRQIDEGELDDPREALTFCITSIGLWATATGKFYI